MAALFFLICLSDFAGLAEAAVEIVILMPPEDPTGTVEIVGLSSDLIDQIGARNFTLEDWQRVLPVTVDDERNGNVPAMIGHYSVEADGVHFSPRFPFSAGLTYRATFDAAYLNTLLGVERGATNAISSSFTIPEPLLGGEISVERVFPSADTLPENQLKLYIHFSAPMREGLAYSHIRLLDDQGQAVEQAFVESRPELWDREMRRLTLHFHPGRVKRGLEMGEQMGPPLVSGREYRLIVDHEMKDAYGRELAQGFEKLFSVAVADRVSPDPSAWEVAVPRAESVEPLQLELPEALDHALLMRMLSVVDDSGVRVPGDVRVENYEKSWDFYPTRSWAARAYRIVVNPLLEDLAGNTIHRLFDEATSNGETHSPGESGVVTIPFEIVQ